MGFNGAPHLEGGDCPSESSEELGPNRKCVDGESSLAEGAVVERFRARSIQRLSRSLPPGWTVLFDPASQRPFFVNEDTCESFWDLPPATSLAACMTDVQNISTENQHGQAISLESGESGTKRISAPEENVFLL